MKDGFQDLIRPVWVWGNIFWINQCTDHVLKVHQQDPGRKTYYILIYTENKAQGYVEVVWWDLDY